MHEVSVDERESSLFVFFWARVQLSTALAYRKRNRKF